MDVIDGLLRIKRIREDSREAEIQRAKQQFEQEAAALRRALEAQQQRDQARTARERALYQEVCAKVVVVRELDDLRHTIDAMKQEAQADAKAVTDAQTQRQARRQAFDEAAGAWRVAARATQKFEDLSLREREAQAVVMERLADLELEEFPGRSVLARAMEADTEEA